MKTRIIVDSASDLLPSIKEQVHTVPMTVHFGTEEYVDGVNIDNKSFYEKLVETDVHPSTSQATPISFEKEFEKARLAGEAAVVITLSSKLSGTMLLKYIEDSKHLWEGNLEKVRYTTVGSVIGTHAGPGAVAVAFFKKQS